LERKMKKSTKGAIAAAAGGVLLLGGAGTLAYWTEDVTVNGTTVTSGHLNITGSTCGAATWQLDNGGGTVTGATRIVPGDSISTTCTFVIAGTGDHFDNVTLSVTAPTYSGSNALTTNLTSAATYTGSSSGLLSTPASVDVGETVTADITLTFPTSVTGSTAEDLSATLQNVTVTATQNHTP
jgi:alternate signal-mediated exported protein